MQNSMWPRARISLDEECPTSIGLGLMVAGTSLTLFYVYFSQSWVLSPKALYTLSKCSTNWATFQPFFLLFILRQALTKLPSLALNL